MKRTRKIAVVLALAMACCFTFMVSDSNTVLADEQHDLIEKRVNQIRRILNRKVLPRLGSVPKTGQTTSYATGDDGDLHRGTPWPNPRFTDNGDGTVTDNMTGLIWLKDANCISTNYPGFDNDGAAGDGQVTWEHALDFMAGINDYTYSNCGGGYSDWRLPNRFELESLTHLGVYDPAVPNTAGTGKWSGGDPFTSVESDLYWTSTTHEYDTSYAWSVGMLTGYVSSYVKSNYNYVWPVRGVRGGN